ncbi:MAG: AraC family transcriptional regulator [Phenylobacterium sp.]|uniref:AraC family transcriptional regulator n=1 Tax=Phenylobacterium sp. TaxID=1871053 RepID=UPI0025F2AB92|nr:AraC family transcriptional regulator [Phenylobacterium sp.]MBA4013794.1 AraC family transcriptional regulator [Phenylobacterium sp.]
MADLDIALRGAVTVLAVLVTALVLRDHHGRASARLAAVFALGVAAHAWCAAPGLAATTGWLHAALLALSAGNAVVGWLLAASLFRTSFRLRPWHGAAWTAIAALGFAAAAPGLDAEWTNRLRLAVSAAVLLVSAGALTEVFASWRDDLVDARLRLRLIVVVSLAAATMLNAGLFAVHGPSPRADLASVAAISAVLAGLGAVSWGLLNLQARDLFDRRYSPDRPARSPPPEQAERLAKLMTEERVYREDLTIGSLAARLGMAEHQLRRLINDGLGHRNFSAFVNGYRLAEAQQALADPTQVEVSILTIALDTGFSSIGPFNRAFKAQTGVTPSAYRRAALPRPK